jgi:lysophospholipase L1-like esterase
MTPWLKNVKLFHKQKLRFNSAKRMMIFGDSNSCRADRKGLSWPAILEGIASGYLHVLNESFEGRTTRYDRGERNGLNMITKKLNAHRPLDLVITMLGTNDLKAQYGPPSAKEVAKGIGDIIDSISDHDRKIVPILIAPPPVGTVTTGNLEGAHNHVADITAECRILSNISGVHFIDLQDIIDVACDLAGDRVHLNQSGRKKVAATVWSHMQGYCAPSRVNRPATDDPTKTAHR